MYYLTTNSLNDMRDALRDTQSDEFSVHGNEIRILIARKRWTKDEPDVVLIDRSSPDKPFGWPEYLACVLWDDFYFTDLDGEKVDMDKVIDDVEGCNV